MNPVSVVVVVLLLAAYVAVGTARPAARRAREARVIGALLLAEIRAGERRFTDPGVPELLAWCRSRSAGGG